MDLKIILIVVAVFCVIGAMLSIVIEGVPLMAKNISIQKILNVLLQRLKFIILSTLVVGLLFFFVFKDCNYADVCYLGNDLYTKL